MHVFRVDFNEMPDKNTVLLSQSGSKSDYHGAEVELLEEMPVVVYEHNCYDDGTIEYLVATGNVVRNLRDDWSKHVAWVVRISEDGVQDVPSLTSYT